MSVGQSDTLGRWQIGDFQQDIAPDDGEKDHIARLTVRSVFSAQKPGCSPGEIGTVAGDGGNLLR